MTIFVILVGAVVSLLGLLLVVSLLTVWEVSPWWMLVITVFYLGIVYVCWLWRLL